MFKQRTVASLILIVNFNMQLFQSLYVAN